jgi:hypothetical protein
MCRAKATAHEVGMVMVCEEAVEVKVMRAVKLLVWGDVRYEVHLHEEKVCHWAEVWSGACLPHVHNGSWRKVDSVWMQAGRGSHKGVRMEHCWVLLLRGGVEWWG